MEKLKFIHEQLEQLEIPYEFGEWASPVKYPYFVGEITEEPTITEDGMADATLILTGFHRGKYIDLEAMKERIRMHFCPIHGIRGTTDSGSIAVFFDSAFSVPTGEADLKKIQINLKIKEWKGA